MVFDAVTDENIVQKLISTGPDHPVNVVHREWRGMKAKDDAEAVKLFDQKHSALLFKFVVDHMQFVSGCPDIYIKAKVTSCCCLYEMVTRLSDDEVRDVAQSLLFFGKQSKEEQQIRVMDWIAHDAALDKGLAGVHRFVRQKLNVLPGTRNEMICKHRLASLVGYGKKKWIACSKLTKNNSLPIHGLNGKQSNNGNIHQGYTIILNMFFSLMETLAVPRATRVVRNVVDDTNNAGESSVRINLRDQDDDLLELPSSMSKRGLYARFLKEHLGVVQVLDARSRIIGVRTVEEGGTIPQIYPSWRTFNRHWEQHFPKLVIARPREDVCEDCWRYSNAFRFKKRTDGTFADANDDSDDDDDDDEQEHNEGVVEAASVHVEQAKIQRELFNQKIKDAKESRDLPREQRTATWVLDYAQNMSLPQFGSEQPGQTYYLCPMNVYVFGIVDTSTDKLHAKVYGEDIAGKGGNCVASMIMEHVKEQLLPCPCETNIKPIKELNLVMDNCGGQNKNRHVLRLLNLIVQRRIAKKVNAIFLVKGHTKNPCDRMFNLLKQDTRQDNIYTPAMLFDALNRQEGVEATLFQSFFDWEEYESRHMRKTIPGIKSFHLFTVDAEHNDGFYMKRFANYGAEVSSIPVIQGEKRVDLSWVTEDPKPMDAVGLTDIKHVELFDKWRPLIPEPYWNGFVYFREEPSSAKRQRVHKEKSSSKKARANRQRSETQQTAQQPDQSKQPQATGPSTTP